MDIRFQARPKAGQDKTEWKADAIIVPVFKGNAPLSYIPELTEAAPWLEISPALRDFTGKKNQTALLYGHPELPISRALFVGLGAEKDFKPGDLREAVASAVKSLAGLKLPQLAICYENLVKLAEKAPAKCGLAASFGCTTSAGSAQGNSTSSQPETVGNGSSALRLLEEAVLGAKLGLYDYREFKSAPKDGEEPFTPAALSILFNGEFVPDEGHAAARRAEALAEAMCYARDLINGPANYVTPEYMEEAAQKLASRHGFKIASHGPDFLREQGLGAFLAVSLGAEVEPRLIILEHCPEGSEKEEPIVIVGKGVTFDSGGLSLKPSAGMEKMKRDMAGAGTVLGLFAAIGEAGDAVKRRVIGIMPCAENMPDGRATRPGDVVKTLSGKTVEITNTDAEGRLLLCDCLTLAQNMTKPAALIDIATLTGACVVALGEKTAGVFTNNKELGDKILAVAEAAGERMWPLPLFDQDLDGLKSMAADLNNTGPREGGASSAALFLKQFVKDETPWVHLDIAGPAYLSKPVPTNAGGATAIGLRTLFDFVAGN